MEIFLSYKVEDHHLAAMIKHRLELEGHTAFLAHEDIEPSNDWSEAIRKHLESCSAMIAVVTSNFRTSEWTNQEAGIMMAMGKPIVPLVFGNSKLLPGFLKEIQAIPSSERKIEKCVDKAIRVISKERPIESQDLERATIGLLFFSAFYLVGLSWAVFWVFTGTQAYQPGLMIGLGLMALILFGKYFTGSWDVTRAIDWCRKRTPMFLLDSLCCIPVAFGVRFSMTLYPMLSGVRFGSYLSDSFLIAIVTFGILLVGAILLRLPTSSLRTAAEDASTWLKTNRRVLVKFVLSSFLITLLAVGTAPIDSYFIIGTPKVGLVESKYVTDNTVFIYQNALEDYGAYVNNQETVHLLQPLVPLIRQVGYPLTSNSTREHTLLYQSGVSTRFVLDDSGRLAGLELSINDNSPSNVVTSVSYCTELNVSSVAMITLSPERTVETLSNGTRRVQQTFQVLNLSPHRLNIGFTRLFYSTSYFEEATNVTRGRADVWYDKDSRWICLAGELREGGSVTITVLYNAVS